jgi:hypothetical protein
MRRWAAALILALAGAGGGLAAKALPADRAAGDAVSWFAERGFAPRGTPRAIGGAEGHRLHVMERQGGCAIGIVPLDSPEEVLTVLRRDLPPEAWEGASHWLGDLRQGVPDTTRLHAERLLMRLRDGRAPRPALVLAAPGCDARP